MPGALLWAHPADQGARGLPQQGRHLLEPSASEQEQASLRAALGSEEQAQFGLGKRGSWAEPSFL